MTGRTGDVPARERGRAGLATGAGDQDDRKPAPLDTSVANFLEEARMLPPGTETLFGVQLAVVFAEPCRDLLDPAEVVVQTPA